MIGLEYLSMVFEVLGTLIECWVCESCAITILCKDIKVSDAMMKAVSLSIVFALIIYLCNSVEIVSNNTTFIAVLMLSIINYIIVKKEYICCFTIAVLFLMFQTILEMIVVCVASVLANDADYIFKMIGTNHLARLAFIVFIKILVIILFFVLRNRMRSLNYKILKKATFVAITVIGFGMVLKMMSVILANEMAELKVGISILFLTFNITMVLLVYLFDKLLKEQAESEKQSYLVMKNDLLESNLKNINRLYEENSKKFHEFKHHLNALNIMLKNNQFDKMADYLGEISIPQNFRAEYATGNDMVDIVLNVKSEELKNKSIKFDVSAEVSKTQGINDSDLCSLLLNIIDNAAEAVLKENNKNIILSVKSKGNMFTVSSSNKCSINPIENKFLTSKVDNHGWGMKIINDIVKKYNGEIDYNYEKGIYTISVLLIYQDI